jgi:DNA-binding FrmR family transcriptional regulator
MTQRHEMCGDLVTRLRRIEGQVRGLQRMIGEGKDCASVITQLSAARAALDQVGFLMLSRHMAECLQREGDLPESSLQDAMKLFLKLA